MALPLLGAIRAALGAAGPLLRLGLLVVVLWGITTVDFGSLITSAALPF